MLDLIMHLPSILYIQGIELSAHICQKGDISA